MPRQDDVRPFAVDPFGPAADEGGLPGRFEEEAGVLGLADRLFADRLAALAFAAQALGSGQICPLPETPPEAGG